MPVTWEQAEVPQNYFNIASGRELLIEWSILLPLVVPAVENSKVSFNSPCLLVADVWEGSPGELEKAAGWHSKCVICYFTSL